MTPEETVLWKGSSSQLVHLRAYLIWLGVAAAIVAAGTFLLFPPLYSALLIPGIGMWIRWQLTKATVYELTTQRLRKTTGLLSKKIDELELYRVKDSTLEQPFLLRMFRAGHIKVLSSDATMPELTLVAVNRAYDVREKLRKAVEEERDRKRVRDVEFTEASSDRGLNLAAGYDVIAHEGGDLGHPGH
ncbi:MAG: hypothetical protein JWO94_3176 [Verrucomicrobiaceae bacterium]|nr:hypothetical protein [Verrucomicrobiaceae bacterium]